MGDNDCIVTVPLFPEVSRRFVALLESLTPDDWEKPVSPRWRVRDVAAHMVDTALRRLSAQRDGYASKRVPAGNDYASLLDYLNELNAEWVAAMDRVSPRVLVELVRSSGVELHALLSSLDPESEALWPVAWAGETSSRNWFDIAREYTEIWHHAQQVFEATGRTSTIMDRTLMHPFLDTLMRGLPHGLRACDAPPATIVRVQVTGEAGGDWFVVRDETGWRQHGHVSSRAATLVTMDQNDAWKVLMKRISATEAREQYRSIRIEGNQYFGAAILETICVMA